MSYSFIKRGGGYRAVIEGAVDEDTFVVPAGMQIVSISTKQNTTTDGNLTIGTEADGDQIVASVALGVTAEALADQTVVANVFSTTASQTCHINISSATTCDIYVIMQKVD